MLTFFAALAAVAAVVFVVLGFKDQRSLWWRVRARWYRDPEANEPSDLAFAWQRAGMFLLAGLMAVNAVLLAHGADSTALSGGQVADIADEVASDLASRGSVQVDDLTFTAFEPYVEDAVQRARAAEGNAVSLSVSPLEDTGSADRVAAETVEHYTLSNEDGDAVCLTVTGTKVGERTSPYDDIADAEPVAWQYALSATVDSGECQA